MGRRTGTPIAARTSGGSGDFPGAFSPELGDWGTQNAASAPEGVSSAIRWPIDRVLPRRIGGTVIAALTISLALWLLGLAIAPSIPVFLASREWQFQPFYFAAHIVALRLFVLVYARGFMRGVSHLDVPDDQVRALVRRVLGFPGVAVSFLVALPFAAYDFLYLFGPDYERLGGPDTVVAIDYLMWVIWSVEWFFNAFIWVVLVGFLFKNCWVIRQHRFRAPIEIVLHDRQYRPFLQMSAQGASILLLFTLATVLYIAYTGGELSDYFGLGITALLLAVGFVPPWVLLKSKVQRAVELETLAMRQRLIRNLEQVEMASTNASVHGHGEGDREARSLGHRLDAAVAILRISYLENRNQNLGMTEARAVLMRMLAPAASIGWQLGKGHADILSKISSYLSPMM